VPAVLTFLPLAILIIAVPGPSVLFAVGQSLANGRRAALLSVLGNGLGVAVQGVAVSLGLGALLAAVSGSLLVLRVLGGLYIVYLGIQAWRGAGTEQSAPAPARGTSHLLGRGFLVGLSNPKTFIFLSAFLPQFVTRASEATLQMLVLAAAFAALAIAGDSLWALGAAQARAWFGGDAHRLVQLRRTGAVMLVGLGIFTLASGADSSP
jgi:threonine/homoserine/homoserine lactone efflux protein